MTRAMVPELPVAFGVQTTGRSRPSWWRRVALVVLLVAAWPLVGRADQVGRLIGELESDGDYKVRLSAALNLAKLGDRRAIPAFIVALADPDKTVRGVVAAGLGKLVTGGTPAELRDRALSALRKSAAGDGDAFVRKQAQKAYDKIKALVGPAVSVASGATYVNIGAMAAEAGKKAELVALMRQTAQKTFRAHAPSMLIDWPGGGAPSSKNIADRRLNAFFVDGTVNAVNSKGGAVECKVSMLLATFPAKSMFGFLKGGAAVEGSGSDGDLAAQDCVVAVIEDLIARKIIPTIEARTH
ncbi:MAG TPA: HEAT repeat domain-containing protein [Kofleriaceae bacterium]|nr:HEAT repeat domain-containing protein [Kofleriaceae bacterium]